MHILEAKLICCMYSPIKPVVLSSVFCCRIHSFYIKKRMDKKDRFYLIGTYIISYSIQGLCFVILLQLTHRLKEWSTLGLFSNDIMTIFKRNKLMCKSERERLVGFLPFIHQYMKVQVCMGMEKCLLG